MKKAVIYFLVGLLVFTSCRKDDSSVFDQSPDDRLNATLSQYQTQLVGAQNGWKGIVYPAGGGTYSFYFKFDNANRVKMYSDFNNTTAVTSKESSYRLKALQQPSLIFDTYSYIHLLADPNEGQVVNVDVNGGPLGVGLKSDFEFYFDGASTDTIKLVGRYNGSKATLIRATAQEATAFNSGQLNAGFAINNILTYFKRLTVGSQLVDIKISPVDRTFTFSYIGSNGIAQTFTTGYYYAPGGINLVNPLVIGALTVTSFTNMQWNAATETVNTTVNSVAANIKGIVVPLRVDVAAPRRWWTYATTSPSSSYWASINGFHVNGVDDAYNVNSLSVSGEPYLFLVYYPAFTVNNDFFGPFFLDAVANSVDLIYGTAPTAIFTTDGRAIFSRVGDYPPHPTTGPAAASRTKLYDPAGFYFVQTGAEKYDMVSASDGKAWLTWEFPE